MKETSGRRELPARIKRFFIMLAAVLAFAGGCSFIMGPDEPVGGDGGNLSISLGGDASAESRVITSGANLPADVLAAMRYDMVLTGPGGRVLKESVSGAQTLRMTVMVGTWRIDAWAYQQNILAGTGSITFQVKPGSNTVMVPMYMSSDSPCYEITVDSDTKYGTVRSNFTAAFAGTNITITAEKDPDAFFVDGTLAFIADGIPVSGSGTSHSFTMPAKDVELSATFKQFVRYVRENGTEYGESWEDASGDLQAMMNELAVLSNDSSTGYTGPYIVKLAAGTYKPEYKPMVPAAVGNPYVQDPPAMGDEGDATFILRPRVQVWGGYPASGNGSRNPAINRTILSGDLNESGSVDTGDAYHVVMAIGIPVGSEPVLDGLTISGGNASVYSTFTGTGVSVLRNNGGGIYNYNSSLVVVNTVISDNSAGDTGGKGGGIYKYNYNSPTAALVLINTVISGNSVDGGSDNYGGGIYNYNSPLALVNVSISGNYAGHNGGGIYSNNSSQSATLINVSISGNKANIRGGGMCIDSSASSQVQNSIIWNNGAVSDRNIYVATGSTTVSNSIAEGWTGGGTNNLNSDIPNFVDPKEPTTAPNPDGNYRLNSGSPAIGSGNPTPYPQNAGAVELALGVTLSAEAKAAINAALQTDLDGSPRIKGTIDRGAYEQYP